MPLRLLPPATLVALLLLASCGEEKTTAPTGNEPLPGADTASMIALVDDSLWIGIDIVESDLRGDTLIVHRAEKRGETLRQVGIVVAGVTAAGTRSIDSAAGTRAQVLVREGKSQTIYSTDGIPAAGSITVTTLTPTLVAGSFRFTAVGRSGVAIGDTIEVRRGSFRLTRP